MLTINAPTFSKTPGTYQSVGQVLKVGYSGAGVTTQALTTSTTTRAIGSLPPSILTVQAEATNDVGGFHPGLYELKVVVTCS